jgi:hypothetical protein
LVLLASFLCACTSPSDGEQLQAQAVEPEVQAFVDVLDELSQSMDVDEDPQQSLSTLREKIAAQGENYRTAVRKLNEKILALEEGERDAFRAQAKDSVDAALQRFAKAQQRLRSAMNEGQKVELSEVLRNLR